MEEDRGVAEGIIRCLAGRVKAQHRPMIDDINLYLNSDLRKPAQIKINQAVKYERSGTRYTR